MDLREPLNRAHSDQRKAERALRTGDICGAIKNFAVAAENFEAAEANLVGETRQQFTVDRAVDSDIYALEALTAQRQFCLRQVDLLTVKLEQVRRQWLTLMEQQKDRAALSNLDYDRAKSEAVALGLCTDGDRIDTFELKQRLWEKINEQDSLLNQLESDEIGNANGAAGGGDAAMAMTASKCPKSDKTVIEELRQCNEALRQFIVVLISELEAKTEEIERLKKDMRHSQSPSPRRRASTTPSKTPAEKEADVKLSKLPELPPLEFPTVRSVPERKVL